MRRGICSLPLRPRSNDCATLDLPSRLRVDRSTAPFPPPGLYAQFGSEAAPPIVRQAHLAPEVAGVDADPATYVWHRPVFREQEDELAVSVDGIWMFTAFDKTFLRAGRVALWTATDSVTRFDSITIAPPSPATQQGDHGPPN